MKNTHRCCVSDDAISSIWNHLPHMLDHSNLDSAHPLCARVCRTVCGTAFFVNFIAIYYHASRAIPFGTMVRPGTWEKKYHMHEIPHALDMLAGVCLYRMAVCGGMIVSGHLQHVSVAVPFSCAWLWACAVRLCCCTVRLFLCVCCMSMLFSHMAVCGSVLQGCVYACYGGRLFRFGVFP